MNLKYAKRSEDTEQIRLNEGALSAQGEFPELRWLYHIPNEGKRSDAQGKKMKQMGLKAGVSDLHLPYAKGCYHGLYIEMKYDKNVLTKEQKEFILDMQKAGHFTCVCYSMAAAQEIIIKYLKLYEYQILTTGMLEHTYRYSKEGILIVE